MMQPYKTLLKEKSIQKGKGKEKMSINIQKHLMS
jgi:hypothetical protein